LIKVHLGKGLADSVYILLGELEVGKLFVLAVIANADAEADTLVVLKDFFVLEVGEVLPGVS